MTIRLVCNIFSSEQGAAVLLSANESVNETPHRSITTGLLIEALLSDDKGVRETAASLAYNVSVCEAKSLRNGKYIDDSDHEEWVCEVSAALIQAVNVECDLEVGKKIHIHISKLAII